MQRDPAVEPSTIGAREADLWQAYCAAMRKAQASLRIEDGIAAGRAWRAFIESFEAPRTAASHLRVVK